MVLQIFDYKVIIEDPEAQLSLIDMRAVVVKQFYHLNQIIHGNQVTTFSITCA